MLGRKFWLKVFEKLHSHIVLILTPSLSLMCSRSKQSTAHTRRRVLSLSSLFVKHSNSSLLLLPVSSRLNIRGTISTMSRPLPLEPVFNHPSIDLEKLAIRPTAILKHMVSLLIDTYFLPFSSAAIEPAIVAAYGSYAEPPS